MSGVIHRHVCKDYEAASMNGFAENYDRQSHRWGDDHKSKPYWFMTQNWEMINAGTLAVRGDEVKHIDLNRHCKHLKSSLVPGTEHAPHLRRHFMSPPCVLNRDDAFGVTRSMGCDDT